MNSALLESILSVRIASVAPLSGGDVSMASLVTTTTGDRLVVKQNEMAAVGIFESEADGLQRLGATGKVRVPRVIAVRDDDQIPAQERMIAMDYIEADRREGSSRSFGNHFGQALAQMHLSSPSPNGCYGLDRSNFLGRRPQVNSWTPDFATFYRDYRITPLLGAAKTKLGQALTDGVGRLAKQIPELLRGMPYQPCLIHGDLWSGNFIAAGGEPVLIDPAVYYGHPEIEWAFIDLFGGFPSGMRSGYDEVSALDAGYEERRPLLQLYHLLAHVDHFGGSYVGAVENVCRRYGY